MKLKRLRAVSRKSAVPAVRAAGLAVQAIALRAVLVLAFTALPSVGNQEKVLLACLRSSVSQGAEILGSGKMERAAWKRPARLRMKRWISLRSRSR